MRKESGKPLKNAIQEFIDHYELRYKFDEKLILESWSELAGALIYKHTTDINLKNRKLYVHIKSSVAKQEMMFMRNRLIELINRKMGKKVVDEIILI
ncbi:DUF721 domain-containing protein [Bacteroidota bacterium]